MERSQLLGLQLEPADGWIWENGNVGGCVDWLGVESSSVRTMKEWKGQTSKLKRVAERED